MESEWIVTSGSYFRITVESEGLGFKQRNKGEGEEGEFWPRRRLSQTRCT